MGNERKQDIKKYQVWYRVEDGRVTSPFIVLSNNRMNAVSPVIVGAPVILGQADPMKWYQIPFVGSCGKPYYVDVCSLFSTQTSTMEDRLYSATLSYYTIRDTDMQSYLEDALGKVFDLSVKSVNYDPVTVEATTEQTAPIAQTALPIQVTVNLNGIPYTASIVESAETVQEVSEPESETVAESETETEVDAVSEEEVETTESETEITEMNRYGAGLETDTPTPKMCKAVDPDERKMFENASKPEAKIPEPRRRKSDNENSNLTSFGRNELENFIINRHRSFGGDMSREQVSSAMNVSLTTVDRYVARIKKYLRGIFYRGGQNTIIPAELIPRFLIDYANDKESCLVKYKKYVQKKSQIYGCYFRYKKALKEHAHSFAK